MKHNNKLVLKGTLAVPGDKSISHRALIFSLLTKGKCHVSHLSPAEDCQSTILCLQKLGVSIAKTADGYEINTIGLTNIQQPENTLDAGNSGTTIRLLSGLLAGAPISCTLDGDASLRKRPMARVLKPLIEMGANIRYLDREGNPPFVIAGSKSLTGRHFQLPVASAQVETAILLAGLQADGTTSVTLPHPARDHTQRMFNFMGLPHTHSEQLTTGVSRLTTPLPPFALRVPGDISSAAFFMVAAALTPGSQVALTGVGINPGRTLVIDVLQEMGADISVVAEEDQAGEPVATITVRGSGRLRGATIDGARLASGIDEIPILALAGAFCDGTFKVKDAGELRVKESDRLAAITNNLTQAGADLTAGQDGFTIQGQASLPGGGAWITFGDHRLAMTGLVANLVCQNPLQIDDVACMNVSYPNFQKDLESLL